MVGRGQVKAESLKVTCGGKVDRRSTKSVKGWGMEKKESEIERQPTQRFVSIYTNPTYKGLDCENICLSVCLSLCLSTSCRGRSVT